MSAPQCPFAGRRALIAFSGETDVKILKFLKPGFRHCLVAIESGDSETGQGGNWAFYNPLVDATELTTLVGPVDRVRGQLETAGFRVIETRTFEPVWAGVSWRPFTCVEAVKRALGIHAPAIITPWQLFKHVKKNSRAEENILDNDLNIGL